MRPTKLKPPIPEPRALEKSERSAAPSAPGRLRVRPPVTFTILISLELASFAIQFLTYQPPKAVGPGGEIGEIVGMILYCAFCLAIIYALWRGANWARIVMIIGCMFGVAGALTAPVESLWQHCFILSNAALAAAWIIYLLTPQAIAFTKGVPSTRESND